MSHFVPDFDTDDDYANVNPNSSSSSSLNLPRKPIMGEEDDLMELLWQNGQVVIQNQRLNNANKKPPSSSVKLHGGGVAPPPPPPTHQPLDENLFIQEDEMASWLHYPLREDDFCSDLLFSAQPTAPATTAPRPPVPSARPPVRNFTNFSRLRGNFTGRGESGSKAIVRESTQVNPSATPSSAAAASESGLTRRTDGIDGRGTVNFGSSSAVACNFAKGKEVATTTTATATATATASEIPGASSSVASKSENEAVIVQQETANTTVDERKRKEREAIDDSEETKQGRGSTTSTKRSRAAQVHNLSERKRRDRINERMKALQELIPRCNKSDKASMLDEAIEYMKSLQLQIQMMSMGCGMMPMMYTGMQHYMPHMAMGMEMGMNRPPPPFMPFPNMVAAQRPLPTQTHMSSYSVHASDPSRVLYQHFDPTSSSHPGYMDPYQQFHHIQPPQFQNQATSYPSSSRVSSSKESEDQGNHTTG
ncbi:hypothetical protein EUTSA_v10001974mg [Eutrema salsugineum]|uniref:BHLH domain-containing protein n=1 Tax=Eutrema salsugineum TaxID=72664 RepID=V4MD07_EUTSA|nr:transcription factor PIF1 [Eutrema salsugineum]ESQ50383.1 hypothetical protein EUTSA_v10001974mg [Eutrema salsugineum]